MKRDNAVSTLRICRNARKLAMGFDAVAESVRQDQARLLVAASDLSAKTGKELSFLAKQKSIPVATLYATMDELKAVLGKRVGVMAVTDTGLAGAIRNALSHREKEDTL